MVNIGCFSVANANGTFVPTAVLDGISERRIGIHSQYSCWDFVFVSDRLDRMTVNMRAEWAGNLLAADLDQSGTAEKVRTAYNVELRSICLLHLIERCR